MMINDFMELMADYMYDKVTEIVDKPEYYYLICLQPKNEKYKLIFIKEMFLLLSANIIYVMISYLNRGDKILTIQGCLYVNYARKVLKSTEIDINEMDLYLKRLLEYYKILYSPIEGIAGIEESADKKIEVLEKHIEKLNKSRWHFMECINDLCEPYCSTFTDTRCPIVASVLFNSCRYVYDKMVELNVEFYT